VIGTESAVEIQEALRETGYAIKPSPLSPPNRDSRIGIYFAARYSHAATLRNRKREIEASGHCLVVSRWINGDQTRAPGETEAATLARFGREDLEDIDRCSTLIAFTEEPRTVLTCGGRHFEAGYALSRGAQVLIVGPRENIFYQLPQVTYFKIWNACLAAIGEGAIKGERISGRSSPHPQKVDA